MSLIITILAVLLFILWNKVNRLEDRIDVIVKRDIERQKREQSINKSKMRSYENNYEQISEPKQKIESKNEIEPEIISSNIPEIVLMEKESIRQDIIKDKDIIRPAAIKEETSPDISSKKREKQTKNRSELWKKAERLFLENWTGILGAIFVVAGTGFLGVYAAFKVNPIYRFFMLSALSVILYFISFRLDKKDYWKDISLWIRSAGAAIFLFGCIGAGGIKALKFIDDPAKALIMILFGIFLNLTTAYINKKQIFASTHVLLSMVSLMIAVPAASVNPLFSIILFLSGAVITAISLIPIFYSLWNYHLIVSILSFEAFHLYWYSYLSRPVSDMTNIFAITGFCLIGLTGIMSHYQKIYKNKGFAGKVFFDHTLIWIFTGIGVYLHRLGTSMTSVILLLLAAATYFNSRRARNYNIRWLFVTDAVISQVLAILSAFSAFKIGMDSNIILVLLSVEVLLYSYITLKEKDSLLIKLGTGFIYLISISDLVILSQIRNDNIIPTALCLIVSYSVYLYFTQEDENVLSLQKIIFESNDDLPYKIDLLGIITGLYPLLMLKEITDIDLRFFIVAPVFIVTTIFSGYLKKDGLNYSTIASYMITILFFIRTTEHFDNSKLYLIEWGVLLITTYSMLYLNHSENHRSRIVIPYVFITLMISVAYSLIYFKETNIRYLNPTWLGISLIYLLLSVRHKIFKDTENSVFSSYNLYCGYIIIVLFLFRNIFLRPVDQILLKNLTFNTSIDIVAIITFMIWFYFNRTDLVEDDFIDINLRPLFLEAAAFMTIYVCYSLSSRLYSSLCLSLLAFVFALIGKKNDRLSRLCLYSYLPLMISLVINMKEIFNLPDAISSKKDFLTLTIYGMTYLVQIGFGLFNADGEMLANVKPVYSDKIFISICNTIRQFKGLFIYIFSVYSAIFVIALFSRISDLIPSVALIIIAVLYVEYSNMITNRFNKDNKLTGSPDEHLMISSFIFIAAFLFRHFMIDIQSGVYVFATIPVKALIEIFSGACLVYIISVRIPDPKKERTLYKTILPLSLEILIGIAIAAIYINFDPDWQHIALIVLAFIMFFTGRIERLSRLRFYSFFPYLISIIHTVFIVSTYKDPSLSIFGKTWMKGIIGIIIELVFLILIYKDRIFENNRFPVMLSFLKPINDKMAGFYEYFTFYPLIAGIAMFFYYSFDRSILTLLWMLEAFTVFVISLILANDHFRYVSMSAVGLCLLRVVFYDLAKVDTLARAVVFIGSGVILIFMNTIYNRYKGRLKNEK